MRGVLFLIVAVLATSVLAQSPSSEPVGGTQNPLLSGSLGSSFFPCLNPACCSHCLYIGDHLDVHVIAGTHDDVGWLITPEV